MRLSLYYDDAGTAARHALEDFFREAATEEREARMAEEALRAEEQQGLPAPTSPDQVAPDDPEFSVVRLRFGLE